ncbi:MAG: leukotoxin LktA family filamentous adhesin, partial [Pseudorhodobacter sp.]|nr:leukotoxin LktA family filamentous adhesin [Pseudorhodobacter sp.]
MDVTTTTKSQGHGINSFSQFDVGTGQTVNLYAPTGAMGTINIVNGPQSQINGLVQSMRNGEVGGDLYIANPNGFVVGSQGTIHGGSVSLSTPSQTAVGAGLFQHIFGNVYEIDTGTVRGIIDNNVPLDTGNVVVQGHIMAQRSAQIRAGGLVTVDGQVTAGTADQAGHIGIYGKGGVSVGALGRVQANSAGGQRGFIAMTSAGDITFAPGARVISQSTGAQQAGEIVIFAEGSALLSDGAVISAAALGTGKGGFVGFSAANTVEVLGDLAAYGNAGLTGQVLIDSHELAVVIPQNTDGADLTVTAAKRIEVLGDNGAITTSNAAGTSAGDVTMVAPVIKLSEGTVIDTTAANGTSGDILLHARLDDRLHDPDLAPGDAENNVLPVGIVRLTAIGATLRGKNVTLLATVFKDNVVDAQAALDSYSNKLFGPDGSLISSDFLLKRASDAGRVIQEKLDLLDLENQPSYLDARATIQMDHSWIVSEDKAKVISSATTHFEIAPANQNLAFAIAASNTEAKTTLHYTAIDAGGTIEVRSVVNEEQTLVAKSGVQTDGVDATAFNLAIAASLRRSRARTIVNGYRPIIALDARASRDEADYRPDQDPGNYATLVSQAVGEGLTIASETVRNIMLTSDAVTSGQTKGFALNLSVADTKTETLFGGAVAVPSGEVEITSETRTEKFLTRARVSGGSETVAGVSDDAGDQAISNDKQSALLPNLTGIALNAADADKTNEQTADANAVEGNDTAGGGNSGNANSRFGVALNISSQHTQTRTVTGDSSEEYETPLGAVVSLSPALIEATPDGLWGRPGGAFYADASKVVLANDPRITISARNIYDEIRSEALVRLGSVPTDDPDAPGTLTGETGAELDTSGKRAYLLGINIANWDERADAIAKHTDTRAVSNVDLVAENVFVETD